MPEPIAARRTALESVGSMGQLDNIGLALSRYLKSHDEDHADLKSLLNSAAGAAAPEVYRQAFERWEKIHTGRPGCLTFRATAQGPLAIGLGNESPLEIGLTTHHTYGVPIIPGSSLKGLCQRGAAALMENGDKLDGRAAKVLFGSPDAAAHVVFWDAWFIPGSANPFARDVITVHHQEYYGSRGKDNKWPTDFDDPNPISFLVVRPGSQFFFAADVPSGWEECVRELLQWSLENLGVGGKTNAGYGRLGVRSVAPSGGVAAIGSKAAPVAVSAIEADKWPNVTVTRNPGTGELTATQGARIARASNPAAQQLLDGLPETAQAALKDKKRKKIQANIEVRVLGNTLSIIRIEPTGVDS